MHILYKQVHIVDGSTLTDAVDWHSNFVSFLILSGLGQSQSRSLPIVSSDSAYVCQFGEQRKICPFPFHLPVVCKCDTNLVIPKKKYC